MKFNCRYRVGIEEIGHDHKASLKAMVTFLEDSACWHSATVGYGIKEIETKHRAWVVLDWKIKVIEYPEYQEEFTVSTWSRHMDGIRAFRDYEMRGADGRLIATGSSKWIFTDTERRRPVRLTDDINELYGTEPDMAMDEEIEELIYDEALFENGYTTQYVVTRRDIDVNKHVHNINYIDIAYDAMPEEIYSKFIMGGFTQLHILYKKEIKLGDTVTCKYIEQNGHHTIALLVDNKMHSIIDFS